MVAVAMPQPSMSLSGFPVAACVVRHQTQLAGVVSRLRSLGRLRKGANVTSFYVPSSFQVKVDACGDDAALTTVAGCRRWRVRFCSAVGDVDDASEALTKVDGYLDEADLRHSLFAVHITGGLPAVLLRELFTSISSGGNDDYGGGIVCILLQLRVYSELCCSVTHLPPSLCALRAMRKNAQPAQREEEDENGDATTVGVVSPEVKGQQQQEERHIAFSQASHTFTFSELFAGIGMFRVALERAGGRCLFAVESAEPARRVYLANHSAVADNVTSLLPAPPLVGDITAVPSFFFPHHDVLTAGFPCQSFAKAGPATGLQHEKGWLFYEVVRVLRAATPKGFILENVEHLLRVEEGAQLDAILSALREPAKRTGSGVEFSYLVEYRVIDGALVTPQQRRRVYFIGIRTDLPQISAQTLRVAIDTAVQQLNAYRETHCDAPSCVRDVLEFVDNVTAPKNEQHNEEEEKEGEEKRQQFVSLCLTEVQWNTVQRSKTFRQSPDWRVADVGGLARTLMGSYRTGYQLYSEFVPVPDHVPPMRFYSIRECARLQGIPEWFNFTPTASLAATTMTKNCSDKKKAKKERNARRCVIPSGAAYKLIGNAVNPIVVEYLGRALLTCLPP